MALKPPRSDPEHITGADPGLRQRSVPEFRRELSIEPLDRPEANWLPALCAAFPALGQLVLKPAQRAKSLECGPTTGTLECPGKGVIWQPKLHLAGRTAAG